MTATTLSDELGDVPRSWYQVTIAVEPGRGQDLDEDSSSSQSWVRSSQILSFHFNKLNEVQAEEEEDDDDDDDDDEDDEDDDEE